MEGQRGMPLTKIAFRLCMFAFSLARRVCVLEPASVLVLHRARSFPRDASQEGRYVLTSGDGKLTFKSLRLVRLGIWLLNVNVVRLDIKENDKN